MNLMWTKHLREDKEKEDFALSLARAEEVLKRLSSIIKEEEYALDRSETDIKVFDMPNWAYKQAFKNGQRATLNLIKKLVDQPKEI